MQATCHRAAIQSAHRGLGLAEDLSMNVPCLTSLTCVAAAACDSAPFQYTAGRDRTGMRAACGTRPLIWAKLMKVRCDSESEQSVVNFAGREAGLACAPSSVAA